MEEFSPARKKLIHLAFEREILEMRIGNEQNIISHINVIETFQPNFFAADRDYLEHIRCDAVMSIDELADDLKILELKHKAAHDAMTADDWGQEKLPWENS